MKLSDRTVNIIRKTVLIAMLCAFVVLPLKAMFVKADEQEQTVVRADSVFNLTTGSLNVYGNGTYPMIDGLRNIYIVGRDFGDEDVSVSASMASTAQILVGINQVINSNKIAGVVSNPDNTSGVVLVVSQDGAISNGKSVVEAIGYACAGGSMAFTAPQGGGILNQNDNNATTIAFDAASDNTTNVSQNVLDVVTNATSDNNGNVVIDLPEIVTSGNITLNETWGNRIDTTNMIQNPTSNLNLTGALYSAGTGNKIIILNGGATYNVTYNNVTITNGTNTITITVGGAGGSILSDNVNSLNVSRNGLCAIGSTSKFNVATDNGLTNSIADILKDHSQGHILDIKTTEQNDKDFHEMLDKKEKEKQEKEKGNSSPIKADDNVNPKEIIENNIEDLPGGINDTPGNGNGTPGGGNGTPDQGGGLK